MSTVNSCGSVCVYNTEYDNYILCTVHITEMCGNSALQPVTYAPASLFCKSEQIKQLTSRCVSEQLYLS